MSRIKAYLISFGTIIGLGSCLWASFNFETFGRVTSVIAFVTLVLAIIAYFGEVLRSYPWGEDR